MMTHSIAPPTGVWNVRAMAGRLILTIEASSMIMNVPTATSANVIHGLPGSCRALALITVTDLGRARSAAAIELSTDAALSIIESSWLCQPTICRDFGDAWINRVAYEVGQIQNAL